MSITAVVAVAAATAHCSPVYPPWRANNFGAVAGYLVDNS
jgi:hypothetical protein